jgi:hypothetical protein
VPEIVNREAYRTDDCGRLLHLQFTGGYCILLRVNTSRDRGKPQELKDQIGPELKLLASVSVSAVHQDG